MRASVLLAAAAFAIACAPAARAAPAGAVIAEGDSVSVRYDKTTLANGFELILVEDHRLPLVAVNLWVHAGPQNEARGQTGFAHLFEHLMFAGSRHVPRGLYDRIVDAVGGTDANGSTDFDRTNYFFTLPSNQLEVGLWLKADMLGYMIDRVDGVALANQQAVVRNERRQTTENTPYGIVDEAIFQALFPAGHPYRASVIGSHADIQAIRLDDVRAFARTYYRPNNATLVLAGDFDPAEAKRLAQKYFGTLKAGGPVPPVRVEPPRITAERRLVVTDRVELPRLTLAWHTPAALQPGDAEFDLAAGVLGGGKGSRLHRKLVYERQIAQSVSVQQYSLALGSVFTIEVVARPGQSLDEIEQLVDAEIAALATTPPSADELQRARAAIETQLFTRLEKVGGLADTVNRYNQVAGDPGYLPKDLARYRAVTPGSLSAAVAAHLGKQARVAAQAVPGDPVLAPNVPTPPITAAAAAGGRAEPMNAPEDWRKRQPAGGKPRPLVLPQGDRYTLPNGLTVVHVARPGLPLASATLVLRAGQTRNPPDRPGLAGFTAAMLQEGTTTRSAQRLADDLARLGAGLSSAAGADDARVEVGSLKAQFPAALAILADVALNPAFDADEIERQKKTRNAQLAQQREQAAATAGVLASAAVYGAAHPLGRNPLGDEATVAAVDRETLVSFWQARYRPDEAALVVAGDLSAAEVRELATRLFGGWARPAVAAPPRATTPPAMTSARVLLVDKPGAPQTALAIAGPGVRAADPQVPALDVMNAALGGLFTSRINHQLREVKGYTYGVYSGFTKLSDSGQFGIRGSVRTDVTGAALADIFRQIDGMRARPLGATELARVRNSQLLSLPGEFETNHVTATQYANAWSLGLPDDHLATLPGRLSSVTAAQAHAAAKQRVDPKSLVVIAVGDKAKVLPQLAAIGLKPVQEVDPAGTSVP